MGGYHRTSFFAGRDRALLASLLLRLPLLEEVLRDGDLVVRWDASVRCISSCEDECAGDTYDFDDMLKWCSRNSAEAQFFARALAMR